jgi:DNA primase
LLEIQQVLIEKGIEFKINSNNPYELNMRCFSGTHADNSPSLSYNLEKGVFNCFSCGFKGDTARLFKELGVTFSVEPLSKQGFRIKRLSEKLEGLRGEKELHLPEPRFPVNFRFKGVSSQTLAKFEAFTTTHDNMDDYVCVPVYQNNKLRFIEGRHTTLNTKNLTMPKYLRRPAGVDVSSVLFPLDKIKDFTTVILVEGIFDALNMHDLGYDCTLCIFGTNNFNAGKARLLDEYGCRQVLLLMDGDSAGRTAAVKIKKLLEQRSINTIIVDLDDGVDPGSLDEEQAEHYLSDFFVD